ncbi:hypothetical protein ACFE04_027801 [Oxalis oulophora]
MINTSSSFVQLPRCSFTVLAKFCWVGFHSLSRSCKNNTSLKLFNADTNALEGGYNSSKRWIRRPVSTDQSQVKRKTLQSTKLITTKKDVTGGASLNVNKAEISSLPIIQLCNIQQQISKSKDVVNLVTPIVFDLETTGLSRENDRIIEIGMRDLNGGENSTFQTLVNPGFVISNSFVHGITTEMACRPDVPRMEELIPILLKYVKSRQKPGGHILWVAHNGKVFDYPFLVNEFKRCSYEIPDNWRFLDTLAMGREVMKAEGGGLKANLLALREHYGIPLVSSAHRAMSDVDVLSVVLQRLTVDLKLSMSDLLVKSFTPSDLNKVKKKKSK